ncbi:relaxin receptor 1 [Protopterus annectens]|uniref:relaxin receptor 1 n=1 Tax=Protopterus annectens TaxID=7888 RepID=UPI001CF93251|nr:relaxin receptor 1 [Protopterus annectens]
MLLIASCWVMWITLVPVFTKNISSGISCPLGQFPCGNSTECLPQYLHCNGVLDCKNHADEDNCGDNNGWSALLDNAFLGKNSSNNTAPTECLLDYVPTQCSCIGLYLLCDDMNLQKVPIVSPNVTEMSLKNNMLRKLDDDVFIRYNSLRYLYLQHNHIENVSLHALRGLFSLKRLYLSDNKISFLIPGVFQDLINLQWLVVYNNRINNIAAETFLGLRSLVFVDFLNNTLTHLPDDHLCQFMPKIDWMDFEGNHIRELKETAFQSCNLTVLVLRRNDISFLNKNIFSPLRWLVDLDLSFNKLETLPPDIFKNLIKLDQLNLSYNPLKKIHDNQFDNLINLRSLCLEGFEIPNIDTRMFKPLSKLDYIYFKKFQYCGYAPHVRSCKPNTDGISSFEDLLANTILRVFVWVVSAVTCFGNLFVICTRPYIRSENKLHATSIMSLCCADCLMGIYLFVIGAYDLKYRGEYNRHAHSWMDSVQCQIIGSLAMLSTEVSVLLLTYLTLEKYICIVYPFKCLAPGKCRTVSLLTIIWIVGFMIAFIPLVSKELFKNYYGRNGVCFPLHSEHTETFVVQVYSVVIFLGLNLMAFIIIVFSYASMFYSIHQTGVMTKEFSSHLKNEVTLAKRFFFIVFTDALCWIPIFVLKVLSLLEVEIPGTISSWVVIFILPINSALNPILYTLTTRPFKELIHRIWQNYNQRRSSTTTNSQKNYTPSFIWVEMWPTQDTTISQIETTHEIVMTTSNIYSNGSLSRQNS